MRAPKLFPEQIAQIRQEYAAPGTTWKQLSTKYGMSTSRLYQLLDPRRYWLSVRRRADRELKKLAAGTAVSAVPQR